MRIKLINFSKPCHWTDNKAFINLRAEIVKSAKKNNEMIVVKLPEGYCKPVDPKALIKYGTKTEAVYLYPDNPMSLIGSYFELLPESDQERIKLDSEYWQYA
jgi:hypothetical protein